jgi:hypothetical protein
MPAAAEQPKLARKWDAGEILQACVLKEHAEQFEIEQLGQFDSEPKGMLGRARLHAEHETLEAVRLYRHRYASGVSPVPW